MNIDLHTDSPEFYVAQASLPDLLSAIKKLTEWDERSCRVADYLLNAWVLTQCIRPNDRDGLEYLESILHIALQGANANVSLPETWRARWQGYIGLLQSRRFLYINQCDIDFLLTRKHIKEALQKLGAETQEMSQSALKASLNLSDERTSQVLRELESHGLVMRRKHGKENRVSLSAEGTAVFNSLSQTQSILNSTKQPYSTVGQHSKRKRDLVQEKPVNRKQSPQMSNANALAAPA